ncbi:hypothetical protein F5B18DRAFT_214046 [Nemania serpens]|nr:hypothetical protein F5B18DRAFT_214046 [Nemania serpens]
MKSVLGEMSWLGVNSVICAHALARVCYLCTLSVRTGTGEGVTTGSSARYLCTNETYDDLYDPLFSSLVSVVQITSHWLRPHVHPPISRAQGRTS